MEGWGKGFRNSLNYPGSEQNLQWSWFPYSKNHGLAFEGKGVVGMSRALMRTITSSSMVQSKPGCLKFLTASDSQGLKKMVISTPTPKYSTFKVPNTASLIQHAVQHGYQS